MIRRTVEGREKKKGGIPNLVDISRKVVEGGGGVREKQ